MLMLMLCNCGKRVAPDKARASGWKFDEAYVAWLCPECTARRVPVTEAECDGMSQSDSAMREMVDSYLEDSAVGRRS